MKKKIKQKLDFVIYKNVSKYFKTNFEVKQREIVFLPSNVNTGRNDSRFVTKICQRG